MLSRVVCVAAGLCLAGLSLAATAGPTQPPTLDDLPARSRGGSSEAATPAPDLDPDAATPVAIPDELLSRFTPDPAARAKYLIGPGDGLSIQVLRHDEFHADGVVSQRGTLIVPILGEVDVNGITAGELDDRLSERIGSDYLVDPEVLVTITAYENMKVFITGNVKSPGLHKLDGPLTLLELLSLAGNFNGAHADQITVEREAVRQEQADGRLVQVRDTETVSVDLKRLLYEGDLSQNVMLKNNDKIYVPPDDSRIYVFGEVGHPGYYPFAEGLTIYDAITSAGGFTDFSNKKSIKIRRRVSRDSDEPEEIRVNLKDMLKKGDISHNVPVLDGDVIIVGSSFFF